ncbi:MAG: response regulator [Candidatus Aminicenantes bacterium]|nr:response regulator [Candidatus Aminicenantes bacterium]
MNRSPEILVVDDEPGIREGCKRALTRLNYAVDLAEDGAVGLRKVQQKQYDLILMDLMMPGIGGLDLIKKVHDIDAEIIIVVITGYATIETAVEATKRGAYDYLPKPFAPETLAVLVKRGLEKRELRLEAQRLHHERDQRLLELAGEKSRLRTIIGCMADGVLVTNLERQLVLWNAAAVKMLRLSGTDEPGRPLSHYVKAPSIDGGRGPGLCPGVHFRREGSSLDEALQNILSSKDPGLAMISQEIRLEDPELVLMAQMASVRDERGTLLGAVTVLRDITKLKEIEKIKSQFVSMVAHELRAPLAAIEGWLDVVLSGAAGEDERKKEAWLERAKERAHSLLALVSDLLEINKIEAGKVALKMESVQVADIIRKTVDFLKPVADRKSITFTIEIPDTLPTVQADVQDMEKLFTNLISNAIKYNVDKGSVTIETTVDAHYVGFHVKDTGIGMAPEHLPRIFDDFFRVEDKRTSKISGTGLGLTIAKKIVDSHFGHIEVKSRPDQGSTFSVYLPYQKRTK